MVTQNAEWLIDEFGFHNATYDTKGAAIDQVRSTEDARGIGFYYVNLDVEDVTMARGDYRSRRDVFLVNASMFNESMESGSYSIRNMQVVPWVAPDLRMHMSEAILKSIRDAWERGR